MGEQISGDKELVRIKAFQEQLANVDTVQPHEVHLDFEGEDKPVDALMQKFMTYEVRAEPTVYISPSKLSVPIEGPLYFTPRIARGSRHSAHGVFFGDLILGDGGSISVAVKPHENKPTESCLREHYNNEAVRQLGIDSLTPVGIFLQFGKPAYSFTELDRSLSTLDSIDWTSFFADRDKNPGMAEIWQRVARQMALIHSLGSLAHGDMAARNIATTNQGNVFFIDWERAFISIKQPRDAEVRYGLSHPDVASLLESLWMPTHDDFKAGIGLFYGHSESEVWNAFRTLFLDEYISCRRDYAAQSGKHSQTNITITGEELEVLERSLRDDVAMYAAHLGSTALRLGKRDCR